MPCLHLGRLFSLQTARFPPCGHCVRVHGRDRSRAKDSPRAASGVVIIRGYRFVWNRSLQAPAITDLLARLEKMAASVDHLMYLYPLIDRRLVSSLP